MTFTDDDLKRWSSAVAIENDASERENIRSYTFSCSFREIRALLSRLEAAEKFKSDTHDFLRRNDFEASVEMRVADIVWREAAGK